MHILIHSLIFQQYLRSLTFKIHLLVSVCILRYHFEECNLVASRLVSIVPLRAHAPEAYFTTPVRYTKIIRNILNIYH
jgi:hypothetical protein